MYFLAKVKTVTAVIFSLIIRFRLIRGLIAFKITVDVAFFYCNVTCNGELKKRYFSSENNIGRKTVKYPEPKSHEILHKKLT